MSQAERRAIARLELFDAEGERIRNEHGEPLWGTAFLTGTRRALSAYHVVADRRATEFVLKAHHFELVFVRAGGVRIAVRTPLAALADRDLDAVLLELEQDPPSDVEPLVSSGELTEHAPFSAWGFAGINPIDGLELSGRIEDPTATVEGQSAIQLFSHQAAAPHARVAGLSGGPCFVNGRVVGIIRSYIERDGATVGGTVYASPLGALLTRPSFAPHIRVDPCADLPPLPDEYPWPDEPFRDLLPFGALDARVLFGRCTELSRLRRAIDEPASRIILLYGQTGVGKSSLLHAGLVPRLSRSWDVRYARRDASTGVVQTFEELRTAPRGGRPCLFLLDQVEETITRPLSPGERKLGDAEHTLRDADRELTDLAFALACHLADQPGDRVVLGFRKEWLSDVERALSAQRVPREGIPLLPMGLAAVEEVVLGLERSPRMKERYQVVIDRDVAGEIARVLCADRQSAIAPALQVLLTKLWKSAGKISRSPRHIDIALFQAVAKDGLGLDAVLDQRLASVSVGPGPRSFGLVLDVLHLHVTRAGTSALVTRAQRAQVYLERSTEVESIIQALVSAYLLVDTRADGDASAGDTALAHDALGPLVLSRFASSELSGQRARRILENRTGGAALDAFDLEVVERGLPAMRAPHPGERELIAASRARRRRERITRRSLSAGFVFLILAALVGGLRAYLSSQDLAAEVHTRALSQAALLFDDGLRAEEDRGEPLGALRRFSRAIELAPEDDPRLDEYITKLVHATALGPSIVGMVPAGAEILAAAYANGRLAVLTLGNQLRVFQLEDRGPVRGIVAAEIGHVQLEQKPWPDTLSLDPEGRKVLLGATAHALLIEFEQGREPRKIELGASGHTHFGADGKSVIEAVRKRGRRVVYPLAIGQQVGPDDPPWIDIGIESEEPVPTLRVRAEHPYVLRHVTSGGGTDRLELLDLRSGQASRTVDKTGAADIFCRLSSGANTAICWGATLSRWDILTGRAERVITNSVRDAFASPNGAAIIAQSDDPTVTMASDDTTLLTSTVLWGRQKTTALPGCGIHLDRDWVRWVGDEGDLLCRAQGWLLGGVAGHVGFPRGTHSNTQKHVHDGVLDRPALLQVVDAAGKRLLELWASGELRAWSLGAPHGTTLSPVIHRAEPNLEVRARQRMSHDGRYGLKDEDALVLVDKASDKVMLRLGDATAPDAQVFEALFVRATHLTVVPESSSSAGRVELARGTGELPLVAWKVDGHTLMRIGTSDVAPPSPDYDDFVLSADGRFGAGLSRHDPSIRLWRNRMFPSPDGMSRGPDRAYWLSARERLPGELVDAGFEERDGVLRLWTLLRDGTVREHYVGEPFGKRPKWTAELPRVLGGAIGPNGAVQVPLPTTGNARAEAFKSFADDPSDAARWLSKGFFEIDRF